MARNMSSQSSSNFEGRDRSKFSTSVNKMLDGVADRDAVTLYDLIAGSKAMHPEYAALLGAAGSKFYTDIQGLVERSGVYYPADEWADAVLGVMKVPQEQGVISGRLFLIGACIAAHAQLRLEGM